MKSSVDIRRCGFTAILFAIGIAVARAADNTTPVDPQALAIKIQQEVAEIRGLPFKRQVAAEMQSPEKFGEYVADRIGEDVPESLARHYGKIVRKLGLYRGPEIKDFLGTMKLVMTSQAGAYYDPEKEKFYVLIDKLPELMLGAFYSHELYHGLQDQHFDLKNYLGMGVKRGERKLDGDQMLARQAVVEGEATYIMSLWTVKHMTQTIPARELMTTIVRMQSQMDMEQLRAMLKQPQMSALVGTDMETYMQATNNIPPFILETMMGSYLKGLGFVFAVQEQGWSAVEKLYTEYPPQSTEQILHPEKWLAREGASAIQWPSFAKVAALKDWELLDEDVLGEFQWRVIFKEQGLKAEAESAAAGWDGDRYAVFKRKDSDAMLLLMRTSWDSKADAEEFAGAYRRLLAVKYADVEEATRVVQQGVDVFIVEGPKDAAIDSLLKLVKSAKKSRK